MARATGQAGTSPGGLGLVYPCDALALDAAQRMAHSGMARPVLIGPAALIAAAADAAQVDMRDFELIDSGSSASDAALRACTLARSRDLRALMKGSLHTDELMAAVVNKEHGLRGSSRISHAFVFDLPRYHKLLALADCVVNIAPDLKTKKDILGNAVGLLPKPGIAQPQAGILPPAGGGQPSTSPSPHAVRCNSPGRHQGGRPGTARAAHAVGRHALRRIERQRVAGIDQAQRAGAGSRLRRGAGHQRLQSWMRGAHAAAGGLRCGA